MNVLRGHEDLHRKPIVGFDMGFALVQCGDEIRRYRMTIGPSGHLQAEPVEKEPQQSQMPDQLQPESEARVMRHRDVDQVGYEGIDK